MNTNETMPVAYAIIDKMYLTKNTVSVVFGIYASREEAMKFQAVETKTIRFKWDRKTNLAEQAYNLAKSEEGVLSGWMDEIV
jgi:hypothetical protein